MNLLRAIYPEFYTTLDRSQVEPWAGFRPMSADGVPILGPTKYNNLFLNTGHGHLGWTMAAASGKIVADQVTQNVPDFDPKEYALSRFG